jgi:hypothetical protein
MVDADVQIDVEFEFQHNYRFKSCPDYLELNKPI